MSKGKNNLLNSAKYITYFGAIIVPLFFTFFPDLLSSPEKKLAFFTTSTFFVVLGIVFALEDVKTLIKEQNENLSENVTSLLQQDSILNQLRNFHESEEKFYAQQCLNAVEKRIAKMEAGILELEESDLFSIPIKLAETVANSLVATSIWGINDPLIHQKRDYLERLAHTCKNKELTMQRLFIVPQNININQNVDFKKRIAAEKKMGCSVRYIFADEWIQTEQVPIPLDFGIWDEKILYLYTGIRLPISHLHKAELHNRKSIMFQHYTAAFRANWGKAKDVPN